MHIVNIEEFIYLLRNRRGGMLHKYNSMEKSFVKYLKVEKNASPYTVKYYIEDFHSFVHFLQNENIYNIEHIDLKLVRKYLTKLYEEKLSRRSVSRKISSLRSLFSYLQREQIVNQNPFQQVHLPKRELTLPSFLYEHELEELFKVNNLGTPLGQRDQSLLEVLYATGIRVSECHMLNVEHVDFSIGVMLIQGKGNKERYVPFGAYASDALQQYIAEGRRELSSKVKQQEPRALFLNSRGNRLTVRGIRHVLNEIVKKASTTIQLNPHKLRHTFATHMLNSGADMRVVQELLGHASLSSTQVYTHITKDHLKKAYMNAHPRANN